MGWYALYKWFSSFRKSSYVDYVIWYKQYLYDEWFKSLSDEDKTEEIIRQQRLADEKERELRTILAKLGAVHTAVYDASVRAGGKHARAPYLEAQKDTISKMF